MAAAALLHGGNSFLCSGHVVPFTHNLYTYPIHIPYTHITYTCTLYTYPTHVPIHTYPYTYNLYTYPILPCTCIICNAHGLEPCTSINLYMPKNCILLSTCTCPRIVYFNAFVHALDLCTSMYFQMPKNCILLVHLHVT